MNKLLIWLLVACCTQGAIAQTKVNRQAVLARNNPHVTSLRPLDALTVGNGGFAFTVDGTGLQTFPEHYAQGVSLGTMSDWGWHSFPNPQNLKPEEALVEKNFGRGHKELYAAQIRQPGRGHDASEWYRKNPHRLHLGAIGFDLGSDTTAVTHIDQRLNLYQGLITSSFQYKNRTVEVNTAAHPDRDIVAASIRTSKPLPIVIRLPYPTGGHVDDACNWNADSLHHTRLVSSGKGKALLQHMLGSTSYYISLSWTGQASLLRRSLNVFVLRPHSGNFSFSARFSPKKDVTPVPSFAAVRQAAASWWKNYWEKGGMADFSHCSDPRASELERRVVLSQYLLAVNCAGDTPPQETGLTFNSWFGKFHLEMIWWHQAQFALWGHPELLERTLRWYQKAAPMARQIARRQGFEGLRWMKMTDPSATEAPSNVGSYLIWQQPHLIYLAELVYRAQPSEDLLKRYGSLIDETARFMASFVSFDKSRNRYILKGCIPAQETLRADSVINSPFELAYWRWALQTAQTWRERRHLPREAHWDDIIARLSPLAANSDGLYLAAESQTNTYVDRRFTSDHPAVLGAIGIFPDSPLVNKTTMKNTLQWVWDNWNWDETWGWDFPMVAMNAARLGEPQKAVDALLLPLRTNTYLVSGHNYQDSRLRIYLPGNGGLLTAVAMMLAGWDGNSANNPGFPADGQWNVQWDGLKMLP